MLEIICVSSLALSVNANFCPKLLDSISMNQAEISQVFPANVNSSHKLLAKGRSYRSRYREEADRHQEEADRYQRDYERNHREVDGVEVRDGRIYRDADHYRRQSDDRYERSRNGRIYRDTDYQNQEYESERDRGNRYYRQERYRNGYIRRNRY